jgi:Tfp pilus assembly protein PilO
MGARYADRIWMLGGLVAVVLLAVAGWFLLIGPKYAEASDVRTQTADTQTQVISLRKRVNALKEQQRNLPALQAALKAKQKALPSTAAVPAFLSQLQASSSDLGVNVTGVTVGAPLQVAKVTGVWSLPITMTVSGSVGDLEDFLTALQGSDYRAVLITSAGLNPGTSDASADSSGASAAPAADATQLNLSLSAFVAPPAGSGTPTTK